jgi:hypothetical protein
LPTIRDGRLDIQDTTSESWDAASGTENVGSGTTGMKLASGADAEEFAALPASVGSGW